MLGRLIKWAVDRVPGEGDRREGALRVSHHAFGPVLGNDAGGVQLGGSGDTADDRPTASARMGDRGLCERL